MIRGILKFEMCFIKENHWNKIIRKMNQQIVKFVILDLQKVVLPI